MFAEDIGTEIVVAHQTNSTTKVNYGEQWVVSPTPKSNFAKGGSWLKGTKNEIWAVKMIVDRFVL